MEAESPATFGELLREHRRAIGLTQEALAERAGLSARNIQSLERGANRPLKDTALRLIGALALGERDRVLLLSVATPTPRRRGANPAEAATAPPTAFTRPEVQHNLPAPLTPLVDRIEDQRAIQALLNRPGVRLVTLVGTGGVGKTRLALDVAAALAPAYADGAWLVELAPLADPNRLQDAVAKVLGLREQPGQPPLATALAYLASRHTLLLLDNCEHMVAAAAELAATLLRACPRLTILTTSREALAVPGERRYRVPSLSVPDLAHVPPPDRLLDYPAVELFVLRAQERRSTFALTAGNARAVAEICVRLDGIPLAIELAAARIGVRPPEAIAGRLDDRFRLLTGGPRTALPRQQTLRAALDWSWDLLAELDRFLLRRLAVFAGGWTLAAAEAVCTGDGLETWAVLDGLDSLVNRSLVLADEIDEGEGRYRLLETVRQYASERLATAGEEGRTRDRHLTYFLALAEAAEPELRGSEQTRWLAQLDGEHDNLRAALSWARKEADPEKWLRLAAALWRFWYVRGFFGEGRAWLEGALAAGAAGSPEVRARSLNGAGALAYQQGDYERAAGLYEESLAIRRARGDVPGIAASLNNLGALAYQEGEYDRAAALYEEGLALWKRLADQSGIAASLNNLGLVAFQQGKYEQAMDLHEESLTIRRALGYRWGIANSLNNLGLAAAARGEYARAVALHHESLRLGRDIGAGDLQAKGMEGLVSVAAATGQTRRGALLGGATEALREVLGVPLPPEQRADHERAASSLRAALGEEAFAAAWAEGRALSLEEALDQALESG